jgi:SulP family sulfate permease
LAGLPPICGLYTALVSTLLYSLFGTSTHSQLSGSLILSFFIRNLLERFSTPHDSIYLINQRENSKKWVNLKAGNEQIDYAVTVTFIASIFLALIYASRLRFLFSFVSKHLLTGFSFGLGIRVLFSQINHVLHVKGHSCISELSFTVSYCRFSKITIIFVDGFIVCEGTAGEAQ